MTKPELKLCDKVRADNISRWGIVGTKKEQSIAGHSMNVALIADHICKELGLVMDDRLRVTYYALHHDLPEIFSGDLPSTIKRYLARESCDFDAVYEQYEKDCLPHLENVLPRHSVLHHIVKLADLMDAIYWIERYGADPVLDRVTASLRSHMGDHIVKVGKLKLWRNFPMAVENVWMELNDYPRMLDDFG